MQINQNLRYSEQSPVRVNFEKSANQDHDQAKSKGFSDFVA